MRMDDKAANCLGRANSYQALRLLVKTPRVGKNAFGRIHHVEAVGVDCPPAFSQPQLAGRALEQSCAQRLLQSRDAATGRRGRRAQLASRFGKATGIYDLHEDRHLAHQGHDLTCAHDTKDIWRMG